MKRTCLLLLALLLITYLKQGYELWTATTPTACALTGVLSDIAGEVTAIPLETNPECQLHHATQVKREGDHLFLVSKQQLYHFDCSGKFINRITTPDGPTAMQVTDYVVDPIHHQLITLNNQMEVHYYNYEGTLLNRISLAGAHPWNRMIRLAYYDRHIWATTENIIADHPSNTSPTIENWLYKFDTTFQQVDAHKLTTADVGRFRVGGDFDPELAVTGKKVYIHAPSIEPQKLFHDTLYLLNHNKLEADNHTTILPLRIHERFLLSTYYNAYQTERSYTYCFDRTARQAYNVAGGFEDNFYHTGRIPNLQAMDIYNNSFCYYKQSEEVQQTFPQRKSGDNPVLFIVKLKC